MNLSKTEYLKQAVKKEVTENILPFWMKNLVDRENGGFYGKIDFQGQPDKKALKGAVLNARILWTFSKAYNFFKNPEYLEIAHRAFNYLDTYFFDKEYNGIFWSLDYKGKTENIQKYCYVQGFWIYGLSEYFKATNNKTALDRALAIFNVIENKALDKEKNGYIEAFSREWTRTDDVRISEKNLNESKTFNTHLHLLEGYTALFKISKNEKVGKSLENLSYILMEKFYNPENGHFKLFFNDDWIPSGDLISYGHDIEGSWLLWDTIIALKDEKLSKIALPKVLKIAEICANESFDHDGGQYYEGNSNGVFDFDKHWWPQAESITGFLNVWELSGKENYLDLAFRSWNFIEKHIIDKKGGEWFGRLSKNLEVYTGDPKAGFWKCPYHNSRVCFEVLERLV